MVHPVHPLPMKYKGYGLPRWHHCRTCKAGPFLNRCCCSGLLSFMSEEILHDVVAATTSKEAWDTLQLVVISRRIVGVGIVVVAVLKVVHPLVLLVIVVTFLLVLLARSAPKWSKLPFSMGHTVVRC